MKLCAALGIACHPANQTFMQILIRAILRTALCFQTSATASSPNWSETRDQNRLDS